MDKDTREHYAALVGRLHKMAERSEDSADIDAAADAIEDLVAELDRVRGIFGLVKVRVRPITIAHTIGED